DAAEVRVLLELLAERPEEPLALAQSVGDKPEHGAVERHRPLARLARCHLDRAAGRVEPDKRCHRLSPPRRTGSVIAHARCGYSTHVSAMPGPPAATRRSPSGLPSCTGRSPCPAGFVSNGQR